MSSQDASQVFECLMQLNDCNRYTAHAQIDDNFADFARNGQRTWHPSVVEIDQNRFAAGIRTSDETTLKSLPQATWRKLQIPCHGQDVTCRVEVAPKKPTQFSLFRDPGYAVGYLTQRLKASGAFTNFTVEYLSPSMIDINKKVCAYTTPSGWFEVTGSVASPNALQLLMVQGVGGSKSFGVGRLSAETSSLYPAIILASERQMSLRKSFA